MITERNMTHRVPELATVVELADGDAARRAAGSAGSTGTSSSTAGTAEHLAELHALVETLSRRAEQGCSLLVMSAVNMPGLSRTVRAGMRDAAETALLRTGRELRRAAGRLNGHEWSALLGTCADVAETAMALCILSASTVCELRSEVRAGMLSAAEQQSAHLVNLLRETAGHLRQARKGATAVRTAAEQP